MEDTWSVGVTDPQTLKTQCDHGAFMCFSNSKKNRTPIDEDKHEDNTFEIDEDKYDKWTHIKNL